MECLVRSLEGVAPDTIPESIFAESQPVVLKNLVSCWPSVVAAREGSDTLLEYLRSRACNRDVLAFRGEARMQGRYFYNDDLSGFNFERVSSSFFSLLDQLMRLQDRSDTAFLYMGSTSVDECLPGFRSENDIKVGSAAPIASVWIGNRSRIAAHFDAPENVACVVAGKRRFTLFPPEQLVNLYVGPLDFTPAGQAISLVDFSDPDFGAFPRFKQAQEAARVAELEPGDALYLPSMWWHHVEALDPFNVLINYWWSPSRYASGNPLNALIHAMLSIRGLPAEQRRAWAGMFEYYAFGADGSDFSHIPAGRLGILGDIDPGMARQLRSMLRSKLA